MRSQLAVTAWRPSGASAAPATVASWPAVFATSTCWRRSHQRTAPARSPLTARAPSALTATLITGSRWPSSATASHADCNDFFGNCAVTSSQSDSAASARSWPGTVRASRARVSARPRSPCVSALRASASRCMNAALRCSASTTEMGRANAYCGRHQAAPRRTSRNPAPLTAQTDRSSPVPARSWIGPSSRATPRRTPRPRSQARMVRSWLATMACRASATEQDRRDGARGPLEDAGRRAARQVPLPHGAVLASAHEDRAVGGEGDGVDPAAVLAQRGERAARGDVPHADGLVEAARRGLRSVGRHGHAGHRLRVPVERVDLPARRDLEHADLPIGPGDHRDAAVRR